MLDWIIGLTGLSGIVIGVGAWFLGIPAILNIAAPFVKGLVEFITWYISELWNGLKDMADNLSSIIFVLTVAAVAGLYGLTYTDCVDPATLSTSIEIPSPKPEPWDPFAPR